MRAPGGGPPVLSGGVLEAFSAAELAAAGGAGALLLAGGAYVGGVARAARAAPVLAPFTALWAPRLALHAAGAAALGAMLLRLPGWWSAGDASWVSGTPADVQRLLCQLSIVIAYGAALPLLSALAAAISAAPRGGPLPPPAAADGRPQRFGGRLILRAAAAAAPVAVAQALIAFHDPIFGHAGGLRRGFGPRFVDSFVESGSAACGAGDAPGDHTPCALCTQPLLASAVSGLAAFALGAAQLAHSRALARLALSRRLAARARTSAACLFLAPFASAAARGASTVFRPRTLWFELLMAADFAAVIVAAAAAALPLAVLPSVEAAAAGAAIGWGDPSRVRSGGAGGTLLEPLLPGDEGAAEAEAGSSVRAGRVSTTGGGAGAAAAAAVPATPVAQPGPTRQAGVLAASGGGATRRALLSASTPASDVSTPLSAAAGAMPGSAGSASASSTGMSRYYSPYG